MTTFKSEIVLGEKYRDTSSGFEGNAESVHFYRHGCERVSLRGLNAQGDVVSFSFDAPELEQVKTGRKVKLLERKTGGPHDIAGIPRR